MKTHFYKIYCCSFKEIELNCRLDLSTQPLSIIFFGVLNFSVFLGLLFS